MTQRLALLPVYVLLWAAVQWLAPRSIALFDFMLIEPRTFRLLRGFVALATVVPILAYAVWDVRRAPANHLKRLGAFGAVAALALVLQLTILLSLNTLAWRDLVVRKDYGSVDWSGLNLSQLDFSGANFIGATLNGTNFSDGQFTGAQLSGADLEGANLSGGTFISAELNGVNLRGANLSGGNFSTAALQLATLNGANLSQANLFRVDFMGADLRGANLRGANMVQINVRDADLRGANLRGAIGVDARALRAATLDENTVLPDGTRWQPPEP